MTTEQKNQNQSPSSNKNASGDQGKGNQGFASMPKEQVKEIAAEGGRHSHDSTNSQKNDE